MNHPFIQGGVPDVCARCRRKEIDHTSLATCEACPYVGMCDLYPPPHGVILLCPTCLQKEYDHQSPDKQEARVLHSRAVSEAQIALSREIDSSIISRADYFNAETVAISELKKIIDSDETIARKDYALYMEVRTRYDKFKAKLIEAEEVRLEIINNIKADQTYLNNLVSSLTKEEQEKYRVKDINYKPNEVKVVKPKESSGKTNLSEVKELAKEHGIAPEIIQNLCLAFKLTPLKAVVKYKEMMSTVTTT